MSFNFIIEPATLESYSIFSKEGVALLKKYVKDYQTGGARTAGADLGIDGTDSRVVVGDPTHAVSAPEQYLCHTPSPSPSPKPQTTTTTTTTTTTHAQGQLHVTQSDRERSHFPLPGDGNNWMDFEQQNNRM